MDKQLLAALDNLSLGLEKLVEALQQKSDGKQSDTGAALQSGNFGNTLEQISVEIKSIKTDTQEILNRLLSNFVNKRKMKRKPKAWKELAILKRNHSLKRA
jgi:RNA binding exosome subunit